MQIYPSTSRQKIDPIRHIFARFEASSTRTGFQVLCISDSGGRLWELRSASLNGSDGDSDKPKHTAWPSIKEYFESPVVSVRIPL